MASEAFPPPAPFEMQVVMHLRCCLFVRLFCACVFLLPLVVLRTKHPFSHSYLHDFLNNSLSFFSVFISYFSCTCSASFSILRPWRFPGGPLGRCFANCCFASWCSPNASRTPKGLRRRQQWSRIHVFSMTYGNKATRSVSRSKKLMTVTKCVYWSSLYQLKMRDRSMIAIFCLLDIYFTQLQLIFLIAIMSIYYNIVCFYGF